MTLNEQLTRLARRHSEIQRLEIFGSASRNDTAEAKDIDLLVTFAPEASVTLPRFCALKEELENELGKPVDLLTRKSVERSTNPFRRERILKGTITVYGH